MQNETCKHGPHRRNFVKEALAGVIGLIAVVIPGLAGLAVMLDPLRRKAAGTLNLRVAALASLPEDGTPVKVPVIADKTDAWNKFSQIPIGAIYLRRKGKDAVEALNVVCPHAGCFVTYQKDRKDYLCPCHDSRFALDGSISSKDSPSPRGLDALQAEVREGQVWVKFQNFHAGKKEKVPV